MFFHYCSNNIVNFWMHDLNAKAIVLLFLLTAKESEKENAIEASLYPMLAKAISLYENGLSASELWNLKMY